MALTKASYSMITGSPVNVMDYMTAAQIADVISGADTIDVSGAINAAITAAVAAQVANPVPGRQPASVYFPAGSYRCTSSIKGFSQNSLLCNASRNLWNFHKCVKYVFFEKDGWQHLFGVYIRRLFATDFVECFYIVHHWH